MVDKIKTGRLSSRCTTTANKPDMHGLQHIALEAKIKRQWLPLPSTVWSALFILAKKPFISSQHNQPQYSSSFANQESTKCSISLMVNKKYKHKYSGTDCPSRASAFPIWAWPRKCPSPPVWQINTQQTDTNTSTQTNRQTHKQTDKQTNRQTNKQTKSTQSPKQIHGTLSEKFLIFSKKNKML